jgi:hypothetical protein
MLFLSVVLLICIASLVNTCQILACKALGRFVEQQNIKKAVRQALTRLPQGFNTYDFAYTEALKRINIQAGGRQELAHQVISWIALARRPLTVAQLRHALTIKCGTTALDEENEPESDEMLSSCVGLVTVDEKSSIIRIVLFA